MNRFRQLMTATVAAAALAGVAGVASAGPANAAAGDSLTAVNMLIRLCGSKDGTTVHTPYAVARCQTARPARGFEAEQFICEGPLDGTFISAPTLHRPNRTNWACVPGTEAG